MHLQTLAGVAAILALVVATGVGPHDDHGDDDGGEHGGDDHGGEHGGHHNHIAIDLQVSLGIVAGLVAVTILFEKGKEYAEEHVPPLMQNVLEALFGELTVLGFIALFAYFLLELGIFAALSVEIYGEPTHLVHLFEQVHFQLFFVMAFFIGEALVLVRATLAAEDAWMSLEKKLANVKIGSADEMATSKRAIVYGALVAARRLHGSAAARRLGPLHLRWWRHAECNDELVYVLLRERFIRPPHKAHAAAARRMTVEHHEYGGAAAKKAAAEAGSEDRRPTLTSPTICSAAARDRREYAARVDHHLADGDRVRRVVARDARRPRCAPRAVGDRRRPHGGMARRPRLGRVGGVVGDAELCRRHPPPPHPSPWSFGRRDGR